MVFICLNNIMFVLIFAVLKLIEMVVCHGRLLDPAARSTAWRVFPMLFPVHYTDNEMSCGGFVKQ